MKSTLLLGSLALTTLMACHTKQEVRNTPVTDLIAAPFISADTANKMIGSYLNSINYTVNDTTLQSITMEATELRKLLADTSISGIKIMFAHTLVYINGGGANQNCGYGRGKLTLIVAGYNYTGNYVLPSSGGILDHGGNCPTNCPPGNAALPFLPTITNQQ